MSAYEDGAAAAFGLMGMAFAIQARPHPRRREYWTREDGRLMYTGWCSRCGEWMKNRYAGDDDATPYDWCGEHHWEAEEWK